MNKLGALLLATVALTLSRIALAGGNYHPVVVVALDVSSPSHSFVMEAITSPSVEPWEDPDCSKIFVVGYYDEKKWSGYMKPMSYSSHQKALEIIKQSMSENRYLEFGYLGNGLIETKKCHYESKGLFVERGRVYSVNGRI